MELSGFEGSTDWAAEPAATLRASERDGHHRDGRDHVARELVEALRVAPVDGIGRRIDGTGRVGVVLSFRLGDLPAGCIYPIVGLYYPKFGLWRLAMLEDLFGNATAEKVLLYLEHYGEGYAKAIADTFGDVSLHMVQRQLARFERAGLLVSVLKGRTRLFVWNPRYPFLDEVRRLLAKALRSLPVRERQRYFRQRRRPRRAGKPL